MQQLVPDRPNHLSSDDYALILERDQRRCVYYGHCSHSNGALACSTQLHFDHKQPIILGGDDTVFNNRLLCENRNCGRGAEADPYWTATDGFWDREAIPGALREVQRIAGWDAISAFARTLPANISPHEIRRHLLGTTTLLAGATGIGKTVLTISTLLAFNHLVKVGYPRVKRVLVLVTDNTLQDAAVHEWRDDPVKCEIVGRPPIVHKAKSFDELEAGAQGADIVVCTVETLWKVSDSKASEGVRRTDLEIKRVLLNFDTLIADECDWGTQQLKHLSRLASHMLQFAMTATPRVGLLTDPKDEDNKFLRHFVLIGPAAVADYRSAVDLDQCLKILSEPRAVAPHAAHKEISKGQPLLVKGTMPVDHPLFVSTIMEAIVEADKAETRMKTLRPNDYYSPHIMARLDETKAVKLVYDEIKNKLAKRPDLENDGWGVSMIFRGHTRDLEPGDRNTEQDLFKKSPDGKFVHPFMRAQDYGGKADPKCKRILLICNIGVRGLNNWPVSYIVDCTNSRKPFSSVSDLVHFAYGRAIRWRDRRDWLQDKNLREFATAHILIPHCDDTENKLRTLNIAHTFIQDMAAQIGGAGFLTWTDLIEGQRPEDVNIIFDPDARPLRADERWRLQEALAEDAEIVGTLNEDLIDPIVEELFPVPGAMRERARKYTAKFVNDPEFRNQEINGEPDPALRAGAIAVQEKLLPLDVYPIETLRRFVTYATDFDALYRQQYLLGLDSPVNDPKYLIAFDALSKLQRHVHTINYADSPRLYKLNGRTEGIFHDIARDMETLFGKAKNNLPPKGELHSAIRSVTKQLFAVDTAKENGPLDQPPYHIAIKGRYYETIIEATRGRLISKGLLSPKLNSPIIRGN